MRQYFEPDLSICRYIRSPSDKRLPVPSGLYRAFLTCLSVSGMVVSPDQDGKRSNTYHQKDHQFLSAAQGKFWTSPEQNLLKSLWGGHLTDFTGTCRKVSWCRGPATDSLIPRGSSRILANPWHNQTAPPVRGDGGNRTGEPTTPDRY